MRLARMLACAAALAAACGCKQRSVSDVKDVNSDLQITGFLPVIVYGPDGDQADVNGLQGKVLDALRVALAEVAAGTAAKAAIDAGSSNATAQTSMDFFRMLEDADQNFADQVSKGKMAADLAALAARSGAQGGKLIFEAFLVPKNSPNLAAYQQDSDTSIFPADLQSAIFSKMQLAAAAADSGGTTDASGRFTTATNDAVDLISETIMLRRSAPSVSQVYIDGYKAYQAIALDGTKPVVPVYVAIELGYSATGLSLHVEAQVKPPRVYQNLHGGKPPVFTVNALSWAPGPSFRAEQPAIMNVAYDRTYALAAADAVLPTATINFGRVGPHHDIRQVLVCAHDCTGDIEVVPTAFGKIAIGLVSAAEQSAWVQFFTGVPAVPADAYILFKTLKIDLADPRGARVNAAGSAAHIIFGSGPSRFEVYPSMPGVAGYNLYNLPLPGTGSIGQQFADNITHPDLQKNLKCADEKANQVFGAAFAPVLALFAPSTTAVAQAQTAAPAATPDCP